MAKDEQRVGAIQYNDKALSMLPCSAASTFSFWNGVSKTDSMLGMRSSYLAVEMNLIFSSFKLAGFMRQRSSLL